MKAERNRNNQTIIGVMSTEAGMGCTHVACSLANYLSSVEKRRVLYIEVGQTSGMLDFMWQYMIVYQGTIAYQYKGVHYVLAADAKEAKRLILLQEGSIVLDLGSCRMESLELLGLCNRKLVLGSLQPWCKKAYDETIDQIKNRKEDMGQMNFFCFALEEKWARAFAKQQHLLVENLPVLSCPFEIREKDFVILKKMIYGGCGKE